MNSNEPYTQPRRPKPQPPRRYLLDLLKRRLYTEAELRLRLRRRQVEGAEIESIIAEFKAAQLINDERFAQVYVQEKTRLVGLGARRIYFELIKRGITKELAKEAIEGIDEEELVETLRDRIKHRWERLSGEEWERKQKLFRYLAARGVGLDLAKRLVSETIASE